MRREGGLQYHVEHRTHAHTFGNPHGRPQGALLIPALEHVRCLGATVGGELLLPA